MGKITFLGDIMCEEPLLHASKRGQNYDFHQVFEGCQNLFLDSDYVVGNLETIFAGAEAGYTNSLFSFNTPDSFATAMAESGINMVTTATNHALDRDKAGLFRTLDVLEQVDVEHIGAYKNVEEREKIFVKEFEGVKIAFLNYTYGTNLNESPFVVDKKEYYVLNLLMQQKKVYSKAKKGMSGLVSKIVYMVIPLKAIYKIKKLLGREYANKYIDKLDHQSIKQEYLDRIKNDINKAKENADVLIVCLHIGGQFNEFVGEQVEFFTEFFCDLGVDYLINTHAHVVQNCKYTGKTFIANCLGNFSISPSSVYIPHELKPEYSIALHMYVNSDEQRLTFSILKICENEKHCVTVFPVDVLAEKLSADELSVMLEDVTFIYNRFLGKNENVVPLLKEYPIEV